MALWGLFEVFLPLFFCDPNFSSNHVNFRVLFSEFFLFCFNGKFLFIILFTDELEHSYKILTWVMLSPICYDKGLVWDSRYPGWGTSLKHIEELEQATTSWGFCKQRKKNWFPIWAVGDSWREINSVTEFIVWQAVMIELGLYNS